MGLRPFHRYRHLLWITVLVLVASGTLLLAACGESSSNSNVTPTASSGGNTIQMVENGGVYSFSPTSLTVTKGTKVTWTNKSDAPHTVTSDDNTFTSSETLKENDTFEATFNTAGTFKYHCKFHSNMIATITVT
jgi:plastocyanin